MNSLSSLVDLFAVVDTLERIIEHVQLAMKKAAVRTVHLSGSWDERIDIQLDIKVILLSPGLPQLDASHGWPLCPFLDLQIVRKPTDLS